jgi:amidase
LVTRQVAQFLSAYDILLTPTNTCLPLPLGSHDLDAPSATVQDLFDHLAPIETFTALFNGTGHPAMLPIGMQFVSGFGHEARLFRLAAALEQAQPWSGRRPGVHVAADDQ